jgi:hypothetical protein
MKALMITLCLLVLSPRSSDAGPITWIRGKARQISVNRVLKKAGLDSPRRWGASNRGHILSNGTVVQPMSAMLDSVRRSAMGLAVGSTRIDRQGNGVVFHGKNGILGTLLVDRGAGRITVSRTEGDNWQVQFGGNQASKWIDKCVHRRVAEQTVQVTRSKGTQTLANIKERLVRDTVTKRGALTYDPIAFELTHGREGRASYSDQATRVLRFGAVRLPGGLKLDYVVDGGRMKKIQRLPTVDDVLRSPSDHASMETPNANRVKQWKIKVEKDRQLRRELKRSYDIYGA